MSDSRLEEALCLAEELLVIPSVVGEEQAIADHVEAFCRKLEPHACLRVGNSLCVAARPFDRSKRTVMLLGHLDTVPGGKANPVRRQGDRLFGLGASDMKAADALILQALRRDRRAAGRHNLVGVLYAREEGPFAENELAAVIEAAREWFERTDLAVAMEPTDHRIELGCLGTLHARVTFEGRRAHSARPWQGENAIHAAAGLLDRLARRKPEERSFSGLTFVESMSATMIEYSGARNVVPDRCEVNVNVRFAPDRDREDCERQLETLVAGEAAWEIVDFCPAGRVCAENALLAELRAACGEVEVAAKQAWTDVGRLSALGLDAINWGPGATSQAHQNGEWIAISAIDKAGEALARWL